MKGIYLEGIINKGNQLMIKQLINKTREVNFALLTEAEINKPLFLGDITTDAKDLIK